MFWELLAALKIGISIPEADNSNVMTINLKCDN